MFLRLIPAMALIAANKLGCAPHNPRRQTTKSDDKPAKERNKTKATNSPRTRRKLPQERAEYF